MDKKTLFKEFVKKNPSLIKFVKNEEMSWQKFYEMFDLYGEDSNVWRDYTEIAKTNTVATESALGLADIVSWFKGIDLSKMQESINSVQRVLGVLEDLGDNKTETKPEYKPRPLYKHFED